MVTVGPVVSKVTRLSVLLLPAGYLGVKLALELPPDATRAAIGVFVLVATWRKSWPDRSRPYRRRRTTWFGRSVKPRR